jgi:uncharacterized OB-fold protein
MEFKDFSLGISQTKVFRFVEELSAGNIVATICKKCGQKYYPPRSDCCKCMESQMEWIPISVEGNLFTFTKIYIPPKHFAPIQPLMPFSNIQFDPCAIGILEVEDKLRIMGWIPKVELKKIKIGMRMKASPFRLQDGRITIILEPLNP